MKTKVSFTGFQGLFTGAALTAQMREVGEMLASEGADVTYGSQGGRRSGKGYILVDHQTDLSDLTSRLKSHFSLSSAEQVERTGASNPIRVVADAHPEDPVTDNEVFIIA